MQRPSLASLWYSSNALITSCLSSGYVNLLAIIKRKKLKYLLQVQFIIFSKKSLVRQEYYYHL